MKRFCLGVFLFFASAFLLVGNPHTRASEEEIWAWLEQYLGSWKGEVTIEDSEGNVIKRIPTAAEYWKVGSELKALTAFSLDSGMTFVQATVYIENKLLYSRVLQGGEEVVFRGYLRDGSLLWIPFDAKLVSEKSMKESFSSEDGKTTLRVQGVELMRSEEKKAAVFLKAVYVKEES